MDSKERVVKIKLNIPVMKQIKDLAQNIGVSDEEIVSMILNQYFIWKICDLLPATFDFKVNNSINSI